MAGGLSVSYHFLVHKKSCMDLLQAGKACIGCCTALKPPALHVRCLWQVDMLVGDIYGDRDYSSIGLSASTIASSFGKVIASASPGCLLAAGCLFQAAS